MKHSKRDWEALWEGEINHVTEQLSIGDIDGVREGSTGEFDVVVTVCQDAVEDNVGCTYHHFEIADGPQAVGKYGGSHDYSLFEEAVDCVRDHLENRKRVLVHCHNGQSRSAAVCIAALAVHRDDITADTAYRMVEDARPIINPDELLLDHAQRYIHENQ